MLSIRLNKQDDVVMLRAMKVIGIIRGASRTSAMFHFVKDISIKRVSILNKDEYLAYLSYMKDNGLHE
jgi:hypothetical protein